MGGPVRLTYHLRPYLADYARHRYGQSAAPLPASLQSDGDPLVLYISCTVSRKPPARGLVDAFARERIPFTITINYHRARRHGRYVGIKGLRDFERFIYHQLIHELITHINAHRRHGVQVIASVIDFMLANNISPDSIDAEDLRRVVAKVRGRNSAQLLARTVPATGTTTGAPSAP